MMVVALLAYVEDEQLGQQCLTVAVDRGQLSEGAKGYKGWQLSNRNLQFLRGQLAGKGYLARSYVEVPGLGGAFVGLHQTEFLARGTAVAAADWRPITDVDVTADPTSPALHQTLSRLMRRRERLCRTILGLPKI